MAEIIDIEYIPNPRRPTGWETVPVHLGTYKAVFDDGRRVWWPHSAVPGEVSAWPLDPQVPEHREMLEETARRQRGYDAG